MHALFLQEILSPKKANIPPRGTNGKIGKMQPASCVPEVKPWQLSLVYSILHMLPNQIWVCFPYKAKPTDTRLWWRKVTFTVAHQARRTGISCSKDPNSLMLSGKELLRQCAGAGLRVWDPLMYHSRIGWYQAEVSSIISFLGSTGLGPVLFLSAVFIWWGECFLWKQLRDVCQAFIYIAFRELRVRWFCCLADL